MVVFSKRTFVFFHYGSNSMLYLVTTNSIVDLLARIVAVRNAESEVEVERLEQLLPEVVALNHPELADRIRADAATKKQGPRYYKLSMFALAQWHQGDQMSL
jgi:hypothetical protein